MKKLTTEEVLCLAKFDPTGLPGPVLSAMGKLMQNYAEQLERETRIDALTGHESTIRERGES